MQLSSSVLCMLLGATGMVNALNIKAMSFNIRYAEKNLKGNEKPWGKADCGDSCRAPGVIGSIAGADKAASAGGGALLPGLQEVLDDQRKDILTALGSQWASVGTGREDGKAEGEFSPILYRTDVWNLIVERTRWLSETPNKPSKSFGAGSTRIVTMAILEHKATRKRVLRANCHLDNVSSEAREKGVAIAVDQIKQLQAEQANPKAMLPIMLTGDFNADASDVAYQNMVKIGLLEDAYNMVDAKARKGEFGTYTSFENNGKARIDFVWLGPLPAKPFKVTAYEAINNVKGPVMFSDHRPVVADTTLA
ncbi:hypothetical protein RB594_008601 [Gaeumannomyces avenae]